MGQPIKNTFDIKKMFSNEMNHLIDDIYEHVLPNNPMSEILPEMFFMACLENEDCLLYKTVNSFVNQITINEIHDKLYTIVQDNSITAIKPGRKIDFSFELKTLMLHSNEEKMNTKCDLITSEHVLLALLSSNKPKGLSEIFHKKNIDYDVIFQSSMKLHEIFNDVLNNDNINTDEQNNILININGISKDINKKINKNDTLLVNSSEIKYCTNLNNEVKRGNIDPIIGRDNEINHIIKIIHRRKCNNVILVGGSGVGKTAIIEGLSNKIVNKQCLPLMHNKIIYKLNIGEIIAGTTFRGMLEERVNGVINSIKKNKNAILFIDNLHNILSEGGKESDDFASLLSEILQSTNIKIIATTTLNGFKKCFNKNNDLLRFFQRIDIEKPTLEECVNILKHSKKTYEKFHNVKYSDESIETIVKLCERYITDRNMPSSCFDILDESGIDKRIAIDNIPEIIETEKKINSLNYTKEGFIKNDNFEEVQKLNNLIDDTKLELIQLKEQSLNEISNVINVEDIYKTISEHTNIPIGKLSVNDKKLLLGINEQLKQIVIGQDEAIDTLCRTIKRNKIGLYQKNKPIGVFFFIGKTGVGKTLLAKTLAKEIFGDEKFLVRFDMSEYADKTSVNKLIGSSAGYVGYEDGGLLTEAIKNKKHCVLLIDEIEKADNEIYNTFLQIFDEGFLTDNMGNKVDFKNTIIILTSNVGTKEASNKRSLGFSNNENYEQKDIITKEMKEKFPPEFLNRINDIVYFNSLNENNLREIIKLELNKLKQNLKNINCDLNYDEKLISYLLNLSKKDIDYGARPINRIIQNEIENPITDTILSEDKEKYIFNFEIVDNKIKIESV